MEFVILLAKRMGVKLKQRVCGSDLMPSLAKAADSDKSIFILGGPPVRVIAAKLEKKYPGLNIAGVILLIMASKDDAELEHINSMLNTIKPNLVFVGLGSPKQEYGFIITVGI